ncbi:hypothetical protein [Dictyobacter arantiisoli]|uniref:Uncharacterized protein n=1 Tax=Dictyobacter arantiisoli TaxID=2014874 RepID=A0A5A5T6B3_9CHLR|nr:hypothetical protein [Dictyobacter arantiisoli]GCF06726.1 hypothetical protein KDI_02900 [Dictyobacter arantiisoli]
MMVPDLSDELRQQLGQQGIVDFSEVALRQALEQRVATYTLIKLADWPARRWKCHYRLLVKEAVYDAQSVPEAYARAILSL